MQQLTDFVTANWELFLALVIILGLLARNLLGEKFQKFQTVDPAEAIGLINHEDALFLDVRTDGEIAQGRILNSIHIPLGSLKTRINELEKHKAKHLIVGCRTGHRSANACSQLHKAGFEHVYNLRGGMMAWQNASLPVTKTG